MQGEDVFVVVLTMAGAIWLLTPVVRALAERIRPRPGGLEPSTREELQRLREDLVDEVSLLRREVTELGERVDFTERWLAKHGGQALPGPRA